MHQDPAGICRDIQVCTAVAFTDEGGEWMAALVFFIATVPAYNKTAHFLCQWHMSNHLRGHCMKLFGQNSVEWQKIIGYWWNLVNDSDIGGPDPEALFHAAFQPWYAMIMACSSESDTFKEAERHVMRTPQAPAETTCFIDDFQ